MGIAWKLNYELSVHYFYVYNIIVDIINIIE